MMSCENRESAYSFSYSNEQIDSMKAVAIEREGNDTSSSVKDKRENFLPAFRFVADDIMRKNKIAIGRAVPVAGLCKYVGDNYYDLVGYIYFKVNGAPKKVRFATEAKRLDDKSEVYQYDEPLLGEIEDVGVGE